MDRAGFAPIAFTVRDLFTDPLWRPQDLGRPVPDSPHAVSVTMPTWEDVIGYEEGDPRVIEALQCGYPRFFCHPSVERLFEAATERFAGEGESAVVFASEAAARRALGFLQDQDVSASGRDEGRWVLWEGDEAAVLVIPQAWRRQAMLYWRYTGEMVSSRHAEALLEERTASSNSAEIASALRSRLASWSGQSPDDGHFYASGMAAIFAAFRAVAAVGGRGKTIQLEFPYVDVFCIQKALGSGAHLLLGDHLVQELQIILEKEPIRAVFCEIPCNPLLRTVDLPEVSRLCRAAGVPLIVDDTIGTVHNVDVYPYADLVTTSLTKTISGVGDVMAGAVWVAEGSPYREELRQFFARDRGAPLFGEDAEVLLKNSEDFPARMRRINANAEALVSALAKRPEIERLYYPTRETPPLYERLRRPEGGYGGLFSMTLRGGEVAARRFYDALRVSKGPSLGTDFTLVCPYTLLAHYEELEWAASCGVRRDLIRVSVGTEPAEDLIERFVLALDCLAL